MKKTIRLFTIIILLFIVMTFISVSYFNLYFANTYMLPAGTNLQISPSIVTVTPLKSDPLPASQTQNTYKTKQLNLFGIIPIKTIQVKEVNRMNLIPCGIPFGIKILTEGVMVVGLNQIETAQGMRNPAEEAGLQKGDVIHSINDTPVRSNADISYIVTHANGNPLKINYTRGQAENNLNLQPVVSVIDNSYKAGIWVRDSSAGIGTITYTTEDQKNFSGLGHPVCDIDTGMILPLSSGEIVTANIGGVKKGTPGTPGELQGSFANNAEIGTLQANTQSGVFGKLKHEITNHTPLPIAFKQEIHKGEASIYTTVEGNTPKEYQIQIKSMNQGSNDTYQNMVIEITDPELLKKTGGIVQGMSGSPIIQDGKIIGAVTHVFVNDPKKGYGIFIENMLEASQSILPIDSAA